MKRFINKRGLKTTLITTMLASAALGVEEVNANEVTEEKLNTETTMELENQLEKLLEDPLIAEGIEELRIAIEQHLNNKFVEAEENYERVLSNPDLEENLSNQVHI